jgi:hypothetical protein
MTDEYHGLGWLVSAKPEPKRVDWIRINHFQLAADRDKIKANAEKWANDHRAQGHRVTQRTDHQLSETWFEAWDDGE